MAADSAVAAGVAVAGAVILWTGWVVLDPIVSFGICAVVVWGTRSLLTESVQMSLAAVPDTIELDKVRRYIQNLPGVSQLHDLHIWAMSTTENGAYLPFGLADRTSG